MIEKVIELFKNAKSGEIKREWGTIDNFRLEYKGFKFLLQAYHNNNLIYSLDIFKGDSEKSLQSFTYEEDKTGDPRLRGFYLSVQERVEREEQAVKRRERIREYNVRQTDGIKRKRLEEARQREDDLRELERIL